jgi:uncharacterized protein YndB with AHSA1/START domain
MKAIKVILIIFAVLFAAYFALGVFKPSVDYGATVEVTKTPEEAWSVYTDSSLMREWVPAILSMKQISGGDEMVGSKFEIRMDHEGEIMTIVEEVTAYEEYQRMAMIFTNEVLTTDNEVTFTAKEDGGTIISSKATAIGANFFWKSMFAIMGDGFADQEMIHMKALATLIEKTDIDLDDPENVFVLDSLAIDTLSIDSL